MTTNREYFDILTNSLNKSFSKCMKTSLENLWVIFP